MKARSIQFKFLITVISAMLAIALFVGGLGIYEVDHHVRIQTENFINATCKTEAALVNDIFGDMEKSVRIMESFVLDMIDNKEDIIDKEKQHEITQNTDRMFANVAKNTNGAIAYYLRFNPEISDHKAGLFYSKVAGGDEYIRFESTDLALYDKDDTEHVGWFWQPYEAGEPVWMKPYYNKNNDILMISFVIPMYYDDLFLGVIGMDFDYTVLMDKVHEIKIYENGFAHLESDGVLIDHSYHKDGIETTDGSKEYLQVSEDLKNGMVLVLSASYEDIRQIRHDIAFKMLLAVAVLVAVFSAVVVLIVSKIVGPLNKLTTASQQLAEGNYDIEIVQSDTYEIKVLSAAFEHMTERLQEHKKVQHVLAYRDPLTGLRNATSYKAWVNDFNKEIQSKPMDFGVVIFDLNYLKETNDRYGHDKGNKLIVAASGIISHTFKRSPVFRIGGDEFLAILQNSDLEEYKELLIKLDSACIDASLKNEDEAFRLSIAKGFSRYNPATDAEFLDVFNRADDEMYKNKRTMKMKQEYLEGDHQWTTF